MKRGDAVCDVSMQAVRESFTPHIAFESQAANSIY